MARVKNLQVVSDQDLANAIFQSLIHEAIEIPGGDPSPEHPQLPIRTWAKPELVKEGRLFFHLNCFPCIWAIILAEFVRFPVRRITQFVLRNEHYNGPQFAYFRGVITFIHIFKWFLYRDILDEDSASARDLLNLRKLHKVALQKLKNVPAPVTNKPKHDNLHVLDAIRQDLAAVPEPHQAELLDKIMTSNPATPMSQFDMVLVHGSFFFLLDVNPGAVGLYPHRAKGYESYINYLAVIGSYLGIQDRFNLALIPNPAVRRLVPARIMDEIMKPCFKHFHESDFKNLNYFAENALWLNPLELIMYIVVKDVLGCGSASSTKKHVNIFYRVVYKLIILVIYFLRFRPFLFLANLGTKTYFAGNILYARWKGKSGLH